MSTGRSVRICAAAALGAGIIWGFLGLFVREMSAAGFTPLQMTCLRYVVVIAILGCWIFVKDRSLFRVCPRMLLFFAFVGVVGVALNSTCYFSSMERVSLSLATILQYFAPFYVVVMSIPIFGEKLTRTKATAVVLAFAGCFLCTGLLTSPGTVDAVGIVFGLLSAVFFGTYTLGSRKARLKGYSVTTMLFYTSVACALFLAPFSDLPSAVATTSASWHNLILLLGLGVLMTLLPFGLYNYSMGGLDAGTAAIITYIEPVAATVVGLVAYGENVTWEIAVGIVMVMAALLILERRGLPSEKDGSELPERPEV